MWWCCRPGSWLNAGRVGDLWSRCALWHYQLRTSQKLIQYAPLQLFYPLYSLVLDFTIAKLSRMKLLVIRTNGGPPFQLRKLSDPQFMQCLFWVWSIGDWYPERRLAVMPKFFWACINAFVPVFSRFWLLWRPVCAYLTLSFKHNNTNQSPEVPAFFWFYVGGWLFIRILLFFQLWLRCPESFELSPVVVGYT